MSKIIVDQIQKTSGAALTWPAADGSANQVIQTDGSGALSFATPAAGKVGQVIQTTKTDTTSTASSTAVDLTGMSVTITPAATSSKILVQVFGMCSHTVIYYRVYFALSGGNSASFVGDAATGHEGIVGVTMERANYSLRCVSYQYLDSPSTTSATTYQVRWWTEGSTAYWNRAGDQESNGLNGASTITAMEILA